MKTTTANGSLASVDEVLRRLVLANPQWTPLGRSDSHVDCYGFVVAVYREGLGLDIPDLADGLGGPVAIARWLRKQQEHWCELTAPEPYCLVALGRVSHITHVGVYHPSGLVFHVTEVGVVGQPVPTLQASGYSLVKYFQHRSLVREE